MVWLSIRVVLLLLLLVSGCSVVRAVEYDNYQEFAAPPDQTEPHGLFPNIFNLATSSLIYADATCGQHQREIYCKLVEHVFNRLPQCDVCDANDVKKRHPIEFAIDGTRRWWQSPSLANGLEYEKVNITLDLRQEYQVAYVIIKSAIAPRPGTWVLEKSLDGIDYQPWQYFAVSDAECMRQFGVVATIGVPRFTRDDEVICTSYYSKLDPLENGEIHTSLVNGRPSAEAASETLQQFTRARFVRLRLMSLRTLNADLMVINHRMSRNRLDLSVTRRYFYAIKDISIGGQCICHGHAESCLPDPVTGQSKCECRHNTCGDTCNRCCPLYNQLPWRQGTQSEPNICQQCQCFNHADRCEYDDGIERSGLSVTPEGVFEGGGRCIDCKHHTDGINCEQCKWTYYRAAGITHYREDACQPCDCDPVGSVHNNCVRDETSAVNGQKSGDCICKPGFGGRRCEMCARGFRNYPKCEPCPCNQHGSLNFETCNEERCICKQNVEGLYCDRCKKGTINLSSKNPHGCQSCFCFGLSVNCTENQWQRKQIRDTQGWMLTDFSGEKMVSPKLQTNGVLMFNTNEHQNNNLFYWSASQAYLGNLLNSYGGNLQYYVYYVPNGEGSPVTIADLIIEGNGIKLEYHSHQQFFPRENISVQIPMAENGGWFNSQMRIPVDKNDMMRALANVSKLLIRGKYNQNQIQSSIYGLALDTAVEPESARDDDKNVLNPISSHDSLMRDVEVCQCPENYAGNSCEGCARGYRRLKDQLYGGICEKCNCQGHTDRCDPFTGDCIECQHNTTGDRCQNCLPGHYGNPSLGGELGQCRPCACPLLDNNHSKQCALAQLVFDTVAASTEDAYVCTACETGYDGNKCEICADGYFGNPLGANGRCELCDCNGNIDPMSIGNCDRSSGKCLRCIYNTEGEHCERCRVDHWGNPMDKSCRPCDCHSIGAQSSACDNSTGACQCHPNYIDLKCDRCKDGHGDVDSMCPACNCNSTGSFGTLCDEVSGQCACKTGVFGKQCNMCRARYFNFTENGCQFCHCNTYGAVDDGRCDNSTGKCECRTNVNGNMCEKCTDGFFNITSGIGCQACDCNSVGSEGVHCDMHTGQCACKPGVTGIKCDKCSPNYFGLDIDGCKECQVCPAAGHVCDSVTGECVCPENTLGEMCEMCAPNAWNYHPLEGCVLCDCSGVGANSSNCNPRTGQCECRAGFVGLQCDRCTHGYFSFPVCEPCECNEAGTDPVTCKNGACMCDEQGQCMCKKNVNGLKCDQCSESSFSLDASNQFGCTSCFCFNRTSKCKQSSLNWQQVYVSDRQVTFSEPWHGYLHKYNLNVLKENPAEYNSYPTDVTPLYWPLPKSFLGDRTASYNGFIRFKIVNNDNYRGIADVTPDLQYFRVFPQVVLVGNHRIILEHIPEKVNEHGRYKIKLHESQWRSRLSPDVPVTRKQLMVTLQNVQNIFIRATYNYPARGDTASIREVSVDVAVLDSSADVGPNSTAIGVEMCECPVGYTGNSCQDPAEGYCRKREPDFLNSPDDLVLVGLPHPCACNGHSTTCEAETCRCTGCEHSTFGDYCQYCKPGYHGNALVGGVGACTKCACPLTENSFSETCVISGHGRGYICDGCKPGYEGLYCEACVSGYFGNPNVVGGFCEQCACHHHGSLHGVCDQITGQCECREGVAGRDCSLCQERHAFIGGVCSSCDQGCTKDLMIDVDQLEQQMNSQNFSSLRPIPWKRVARIKNNTSDLRKMMDLVHFNVPDDRTMTLEIIGLDDRCLSEVSNAIDQGGFLLQRSNKSKNSMEAVVERTLMLAAEAQKEYAVIHNIINQLRHFVQHGGSKQDLSNLASWIDEGRTYLDATRERGVYIEKRYNRGIIELEKSEALLKKITSHALNDTASDELRKQLNDVHQWLDDYRDTIWDNARQDTISGNKITAVVAKRIDRFNNVAANISEILARATDDIGDAEQNVTNAKHEKILNMFDDYQRINEAIIGEVDMETKVCRDEADKYAQLLDEYQQEYLQTSENHAQDLEAEAVRLQNSFADTKMAAETTIRASNAYKEIVEALRNASEAAEKAKLAAEGAYLEADPSSATSMVNVASESRNQSISMMPDDEDLGLKVLMDKRAQLLRHISIMNETIRWGRRHKSAFGEQYQSFDDQHDRMTGLVTAAADSEERAAQASESAKKHSDEVKQLNETVSNLNEFAGERIRNVTENVRKANLEAQTALERISDVRKRNDEDEKKITILGNQIKLLQEKIKEAREKASRIRISMRSDDHGRCRRSFISPAQPAPRNTITLRYRPPRNVPDSLLFITRTKAKRTQAAEYIAMEVHNRRVIAHWDIGSGERMITNTHTINYITAGDRTSWYHINLNRIGNAMTLTVALKHSTSGEGERTVGEPTVVSVGSQTDEDSVIFNTVPGETKIEFGCDQKLAEELELVSNKFHGTIGELIVDQEMLPLWAFAKSNQACDGDFAAPVTPFNGYMFRDGFAQIRLPLSDRPSATQVSIIFSAYSSDGLIYFRGNPDNENFICIELRDGHVALKMNIGKGSFVSVESKKSSYTDGRTHTVRAIRNNQQIHLQVDNENDRTTLEISDGTAALKVNDADHFIGGVPPGFNITAFKAFEINWNGFFGCIQSVKPSQVSELDLDNPIRSQSKLHGCSFKDGERLEPADRIVSFSQPGFLITRGVRFTDNSTLAFSFRTRSANATLLFQSSRLSGIRKRRDAADEEDGMGYIAFYLYRGFLVVHLGTDASQRSKVLTLRSEVMYNDGQLHSVLLRRQETLVRLSVDDRETASGTLAEHATIGSTSYSLFIGGFPDKTKPSASEMPNAEPLIGCVSSIFSDYQFVPFIPEAHQATFGVCSFEHQPASVVHSIEPVQADEQNAFDMKSSKISLYFTGPTVSTNSLYYFGSGTALASKISPTGIWTHNVVDEDLINTKTTLAPEALTSALNKTFDFIHNEISPTHVAPTAMATGRKQCTPNIQASMQRNRAARFGISETSHSRINFENHYPDVKQFTVEFAFRTAQRNCLLWIWANYKNYTRYIMLGVVEGKLQLEVKGHKQPKILLYESSPLSDDEWHNVHLIKQERELSLKVDGNPSQKMREVPNPKVMRKRMYVGGVISRHRKQFKLLSPQFSGCIRDFIVDNQQYDLLATSRDIIPCSATSKSTYIHDGGYAVFSSLKMSGANSEIWITIEFRAAVESGFIFGLMTNFDAENTRILLYMNSGLATFELFFNEERRDLKHVFEKNLCDNKWHNVSVHITSSQISVGVDKHNERLPTKMSLESIELFRSLPVYVGGVSAQTSKKINVPSMVGCFRHLHLAGKPVSFKKAKKTNKLLLNSCPFSNH